MCPFLGGTYPVRDVGGLHVLLQEPFGLGTP